MHNNELILYLENKLLDKYSSDFKGDVNPRYLKRFNHSKEVMKKALEICTHYGYDSSTLMYKNALVASLLHDYCKFTSLEEYRDCLIRNNLSLDLLNLPDGIMHAYIGSYIIKETFPDLVNLEVFNAIKYHSTGKSNMTFLEKVIYVSDYAEDSRVGDGFKEVRKCLEESLELAVLKESEMAIEFIKSKNGKIDELTIECFNYYKEEIWNQRN